jgi:hypothetical protein
MAWLTTFTFLCCATAAGLFVPGAIMDYIPSMSRTAELYLRTSQAVAIIAMVAALILCIQSMRMAS